MIVHGYTSELELVPVEMTIDEIAALRIDPWRVDLFDPHPIAKEVAGQELRFNRLADVVLVYRSSAEKSCVGVFEQDTIA